MIFFMFVCWSSPYTSKMSVNVEMRRIDLDLAGHDLNESSDRGRILNTDRGEKIKIKCGPNLIILIFRSTWLHFKMTRTHRIVYVFWEELHFHNLFLLGCSAQEDREEQQRSQSLQQVWSVPQHALDHNKTDFRSRWYIFNKRSTSKLKWLS